jgi:magnesium-transporting ATPase (P-type)
VVTDDDFTSIVTAVRLGRAIWTNVGRFVTYVFASNVAELVPFVAFVLFGIPLPLTVMQVLAVDLGTDLLPALALGAEPPEPGSMDRPPRARRERLLGPRRLLHAYGFLGVIEAVLAMVAFFATYRMAGWRPGEPMAGAGPLYQRATTMTLAAIVAGQIGNAFACRTERQSVFRAGLFRNRMLLLGIAAEIGLLLALVYVPPIANVFGTAPLGLEDWRLLAWFPPVVLLADELRKWILRRREAGARARRASARDRGERGLQLAG